MHELFHPARSQEDDEYHDCDEKPLLQLRSRNAELDLAWLRLGYEDRNGGKRTSATSDDFHRHHHGSHHLDIKTDDQQHHKQQPLNNPHRP